MDALIVLLSVFGIGIVIVWLILCGIINVAAFGVAVKEVVKEDIEYYENKNKDLR